jgi:hypothetical protein
MLGLRMTGVDKRANHEVERGKAPMQSGGRKAQWSTPKLIRPSLDLTEAAKAFPSVTEFSGTSGHAS